MAMAITNNRFPRPHTCYLSIYCLIKPLPIWVYWIRCTWPWPGLLHISKRDTGANVTSRVRCEITNTCPGVYMGLFINKISPEKIQRHITNTVKIQQNAQSFYITHTLIYSPFIHSFVRSFIHITPLMHHPCITYSSHTASYYASPIHHTASPRIIPIKHYIQQITLTHVLNASQRWCIITIMHHSDDASQQCITTLMHYGTS